MSLSCHGLKVHFDFISESDESTVCFYMMVVNTHCVLEIGKSLI